MKNLISEMNIVQNMRKICRVSQNKFNVRSISEVKKKVIIKTDSKTGVATMLMNNPPLNIFNSKFLVEFTNVISQLESDPSVSGVILTSNFNGKVFSAGLNIFNLYQRPFEEIVEYWTLVQDFSLALYKFKKPIVAAINGHSPAGGCATSMLCDYRVMMDDESKKIGMNESHIGVIPVPFITNLMKSIIGSRKAELSLLRGDMFSPREALNMNLVDEVVGLQEVHDVALQFLKPLVKIPLPTYHGMKLNLRKGNISQLADGRLRREDAENFAAQTLQPIVQGALAKYIDQLQQK